MALILWPRTFGVDKSSIDPLVGPEKPLNFLTSDSYVFATVLKQSVSETQNHLPKLEAPWELGAITGLTDPLLRYTRLPFSATIFHLPAFLALIPGLALFFLTRQLGSSSSTAFSASLLSSWSWFFFQRSQSGYLDTDSLALGWPLCFLALYFWDQRHPSRRKAMLLGICTWATPFLYTKGIPLMAATLLFLSLLEANAHKAWRAPSWRCLIWAMALPLVPTLPMLTLLFFLSFPSIFDPVRKWKLPTLPKKWLTLLITSLVLLSLYFTGGFSRILLYLDQDHGELQISSNDHLFIHSMRTGLEAMPPTLEELGRWVGGHWTLLLIGLFAWTWLSIKKPFVLSLLPMAGLGLICLVLGRRFALYLTPAFALGLAWTIESIWVKVRPSWFAKALEITLTLCLALFLLAPSLNHPPLAYVSKGEMTALESIRDSTPQESLVLGWWDDSRVVTFHAERETFLPFNSFGGEKNHWISRWFLAASNKESNQVLNGLSRLGGQTLLTRHLLSQGPPPWEPAPTFSSPLRPITLYLPFELILKMGTLQTFGSRPEEIKAPLMSFLILNMNRIEGDLIFFDNAFSLNRKKLLLLNDKGEQLHLGRAHILSHPNDGSAHLSTTHLNPMLKNDLVFLPKEKRILVMDRKLFNSTLFQMGALHLFDPELWTPLYLGPEASAYQRQDWEKRE